MNFSKELTVVAAIIAAGFATNAAAEEATDTIDVYTGLVPVLEMTCTDVNFGVWRVPTGGRGFSTVIRVNQANFFAALRGDTEVPDTGVALASNYDAPAAGNCTVTGSAVSSANGTATILENATGSFGGTDANPFADGLGKPTVPVSGFTYELSLSNTTPAIDENGEAEFQVIGEMEIPMVLVADNYGAYKGGAATLVEFNDEQSGD